MARPIAYYRLTSARHRRGLSYLEVLIAAGIGLVGLLGAISMLPVAIRNLQRGVVSDTTAYIGPSALEQAQGTGMLDRSNWMGYNNSTLKWNALATPYLSGYPTSVSGTNTGIALGPWCSVCLDPRFCAELDTSTATGISPGYFPYVTPTNTAAETRMLRMTLQVAAGTPMTVNQARLLFKVADDVVTIRPEDGTSPASLAPLFGKSNTPVRRDYMGDFEWMITLSPKMNGVMATSPSAGTYVDSNGAGTSLPFMPTNQYRASVVVFHQRLSRLDTLLDGSSNEPDAERVVEVASFLANGFNGGDVLIQTRASRPALDLAVRVNDWVMLSGVAKSPGTGQAMGPLFQWYRVVSVDGEAVLDSVSGRYQRYVTLEGGDWPIYPAGQNLIPGGTQMTIVSGVVGVYEHTVTVDN